MKKISLHAKWFLSFAFAAFLATATFTGCENKDNTLAPSAAGQFNPTSAHAANGADLSHAMDIQNRHHDEMMQIDGVNGTATGLTEDGTPAVYVFSSTGQGIPSSIEGTPVHVEITGQANALALTGASSNPTQSGYSVGNDNECAAGTISCVVADNNGTRYFLSNNHVFARVNAAAIGERIDQPGRYDAVPQCAQTPQVASLSKFVPIVFGKRSNNTVDCAIAEFAAGVTGTTSNPFYTPLLNTGVAFVGEAVEKVGRTTGQQNGNVTAVNWKGTINYGNGKSATFSQQVYIASTTFSAAGDSGSLIVDSNTLTPVALLFAGSPNSTIANPIGAVMAALGVHIVAN